MDNFTTGQTTGQPTPEGGASIAIIIFQVVAGVIVALIIYWLSLLAIDRDKLVITSKYTTNKPASFAIVDGYVDCASALNMRFNTYNPESKAYLAMPRSVNRKGGAQFSYSFWLYLDDVSDENIKNKVLFCKGDPRAYEYKVVNKADSVILDSGKAQIVKCPLVRFGQNYKEMVVEFNTTEKVDERMVIMNNVSENDSAVRRNAMSLTPHYWVMFTYVFEDNVPINDFENGTAIKFYINDTLYQLHRSKSTLKQNNGDMVVLPDDSGVGIKSARIGDLYYHNYALDDIKVKELYTRGPAKTRFTRNANFGQPLYLSASNRIDQSNM